MFSNNTQNSMIGLAEFAALIPTNLAGWILPINFLQNGAGKCFKRLYFYERQKLLYPE